MPDKDETAAQVQELQELLEHLPENRLGQPFENPAILEKIKSYFKADDKDSLPQVIGLFGGWGSGKTSLLACIAKAIKRQSPSNPIVLMEPIF